MATNFGMKQRGRKKQKKDLITYVKKMQYLKGVLFGILIVAWIPCLAQDTADSLKPYCQPKYIVWKIARDLSTLDRQTILLDSAHKVITLKNVALERAELTIQASDSAYLAKDNEAKTCRLLLTNQSALQKVEIKREKVKGNKKGLVGIGIGFIAALLLL